MTRDDDSKPHSRSRFAARGRHPGGGGASRADFSRIQALAPGVSAEEREAVVAEICGLHQPIGVMGRIVAEGGADDLLFARMMRGVRDGDIRAGVTDYIAWALIDGMALSSEQEPRREAIARDLANRWADRDPEAVKAVEDVLGPESDFDRVLGRSVAARLDRYGKYQTVIGSAQRSFADALRLAASISAPARDRSNVPLDSPTKASMDEKNAQAAIPAPPPAGRRRRRRTAESDHAPQVTGPAPPANKPVEAPSRGPATEDKAPHRPLAHDPPGVALTPDADPARGPLAGLRSRKTQVAPTAPLQFDPSGHPDQPDFNLQLDEAVGAVAALAPPIPPSGPARSSTARQDANVRRPPGRPPWVDALSRPARRRPWPAPRLKFE